MSSKNPFRGDPAELIKFFVFRARRVAEHSLARDRDRLKFWAEGQRTLKVVDGQPQALILDLPDEEALDSLAARCRPFILSKDAVYYRTVLTVLRGLFAEAEGQDLVPACKSLVEGWDRYTQSLAASMGYTLAQMKDGTAQPAVTDRDLAYAWMYGDLVHVDRRAMAKGGSHDLDARFDAAVLLVCGLALMTIATLNLVQQACSSGILTIDQEVFSQPVTARGSREVLISAMAVGPVGTPAETLDQAIDDSRSALKGPSQDFPGSRAPSRRTYRVIRVCRALCVGLA